MRAKSWASLAGVAAAVLAATIFMSVGSAPATAYESHWGANYFPNVELIDQYGHKLRFYDDLLKGKTVAIEQFYTHCIDICPLETARLAQVQKMLGSRVGKDIFFYSISIDPKRDTPEVMKEYAEKYHASPGWLFLTGKKEDIDLIDKKLGFQDPQPGDRDGHSPHLLLGNEATGQWIRNNALDNPRFLAIMIGDWMNSWQSKKEDRMISARAIPKPQLSSMTTMASMSSSLNARPAIPLGEGNRSGRTCAVLPRSAIPSGSRKSSRFRRRCWTRVIHWPTPCSRSIRTCACPTSISMPRPLTC